jgi:hypothetical protein
MSSFPIEGKREQCRYGPYAGTDVATVRTTYSVPGQDAVMSTVVASGELPRRKEYT